MKQQMWGLTIPQPWATCIVDGPKRVENRDWRPRVSLPFWIALHAGQTDDKVSLDWVKSVHPKLVSPVFWERGAIIGVCRVVEVVAYAELTAEQQDDHDAWLSGPWCWMLDDVVGLSTPVKCKGALGLWRLEDAVLQEVRREYAQTKGFAAPHQAAPRPRTAPTPGRRRGALLVGKAVNDVMERIRGNHGKE